MSGYSAVPNLSPSHRQAASSMRLMPTQRATSPMVPVCASLNSRSAGAIGVPRPDKMSRKLSGPMWSMPMSCGSIIASIAGLMPQARAPRATAADAAALPRPARAIRPRFMSAMPSLPMPTPSPITGSQVATG